MKKLAVVTTHPVQYYAPLFRLIHQRGLITLKVFYSWGDSTDEKHDPGFGRAVAWDIPLLDGYLYEFMPNCAKKPGSHHFNGIRNPGLIKKLEEWRPDALLVFGWAYHSHLKALRHFKNKVPVYFRGDSTLLDERNGIQSVLRSLWLKWVYRHVDHAFYVGQNNKAYFKKYGLQEGQLIFAPHAVDNERFGITDSDQVNRLRKSLDIHSDETIVLFAGKLEHKKSPLLLLQAFTRLDKNRGHLLFVGNGNLEEQLKEAAAGHKNVHFLNFQNQSVMPLIYHAANLFCLPSGGPGETWGLVVNEAMAANKAVLLSDKCGCAADLVTTDNGLVFKAGDVDGLTASLKKLLADPALLFTMGENSGARIKDWNFTRIAQAIEQSLNS